MFKKILILAAAFILTVSLAACGAASFGKGGTTAQTSSEQTQEAADGVAVDANVTSDGAIDASDLFTDRDLTQTADLTDAETITLKNGEDVSITSAGVYVISGTASNVTIRIDAADEDKVQLVLDGVSITNTDSPCIYVVNADKVFVTTTDSTNTLKVTGTFTADGTTNTDAVIFSKDDLVLNGVGTLEINSTANGISGKDDIKITGGTIVISSTEDAIEANDSIAVADGSIKITTDKDGLHAENDEDDSVGYIYICGGTFEINAADDGIQGTTILQIDGGKFTIDAEEGLEATFVQINGGTIDITANDDGINASDKSSKCTIGIEINGGDITIEMGQGDTDAVDSNGSLIINGGTLDITAQSPFDYDGTAEKNGGTIIVNGTETDTITNQMMGGGAAPGGMQNRSGAMPGGRGGMQGGPGGMGR